MIIVLRTPLSVHRTRALTLPSLHPRTALDEGSHRTCLPASDAFAPSPLTPPEPPPRGPGFESEAALEAALTLHQTPLNGQRLKIGRSLRDREEARRQEAPTRGAEAAQWQDALQAAHGKTKGGADRDAAAAAAVAVAAVAAAAAGAEQAGAALGAALQAPALLTTHGGGADAAPVADCAAVPPGWSRGRGRGRGLRGRGAQLGDEVRDPEAAPFPAPPPAPFPAPPPVLDDDEASEIAMLRGLTLSAPSEDPRRRGAPAPVVPAPGAARPTRG